MGRFGARRDARTTQSRARALAQVVPIGCMFKPLNEREDLPPVHYEPVHCTKQTCQAILNPYCSVDVRAKLWICPFCHTRNGFPPQYREISEQKLPLELLQQFSTIEYTLPRTSTVAPIFLLIVDTCIDDEDMQALRDSLIMSLSVMPQHALVGLITFGTTVQVHELSAAGCPKAYVFRGTKDVSSRDVAEQLGLVPRRQGAPAARPPGAPGQPGGPQGVHRFLQAWRVRRAHAILLRMRRAHAGHGLPRRSPCPSATRR